MLFVLITKYFVYKGKDFSIMLSFNGINVYKFQGKQKILDKLKTFKI